MERLAEQAIELGHSSHGLEGIVNSVKRRKESERSPTMPIQDEAPPALPPVPPPSLPQRPALASSLSSTPPSASMPSASAPPPAPAPVATATPEPEAPAQVPGALTGFVNLMIRQEDHDWMIENRVKPKQVFAESRKLRELVDEETEKLAGLLAEHYSKIKGEPVSLKTAMVTALWRRAVDLELIDGSIATNASEEEMEGEDNGSVSSEATA